MKIKNYSFFSLHTKIIVLAVFLTSTVVLMSPIIVFSINVKQKINVTVSSSVPYNHCVDTIQNYDEAQIDCGGVMCQSCTFHCSNSIKDYDETGVDCGGVFCSACGGGGGGGGGGGSVTSIASFIGKAAPNSLVRLLKDGVLVSTVTSTALGDFTIGASNLSSGNYTFSLYYQDSAGRRSGIHTVSVPVTQQSQTITRGNILLSPTIDADKREIKQGEQINIFGESAPGSSITISIVGNDGIEELYRTTASSRGTYQISIDTSAMKLQQYSAKAKAALGVLMSEYTTPLTFTVGEKTIIKEPDSKCPQKADLNDDCRVNLVDFSIAAYWFKRQISQSFSDTETVELNGDGLINLVDFSILAYYWTG